MKRARKAAGKRLQNNGVTLQTPPCQGGHNPCLPAPPVPPSPSQRPGMPTGVLALKLLPAGEGGRGVGLALGEVKRQIHLIPCVRGRKEPGLGSDQEPLRIRPALLGTLLLCREGQPEPRDGSWSAVVSKALTPTADLPEALQALLAWAGMNLLWGVDGVGQTPNGCRPLFLEMRWSRSKLSPTRPGVGGRS